MIDRRRFEMSARRIAGDHIEDSCSGCVNPNLMTRIPVTVVQLHHMTFRLCDVCREELIEALSQTRSKARVWKVRT
jgi:hypothetical protein